VTAIGQEAAVVTGGWRGPAFRVLDACPGQTGVARDWIGSAVSGHCCPADPQDAALIVSELFTNALAYGPGGRVLVGCCLQGTGARITVCDGGGTSTPRLVEDTDLTEGGRGLQIVSSLATGWGTFRLAPAQVVWCDLGEPPDAEAADAWAWLHPVLLACDLSAPGRTQAAAVSGVLAAAGTR
jgi:Histidine kinase-like ATPase domain